MATTPKMRAGVVNIRKQFRKTKLCSYHLAGRCTFGAQCFYAHNAEDVEASPDLKKTKLCSAWQEGTCDRGAACGYAHGAKELRSTGAVYKTVQCQWYMAGHCSLGQSCRYAHGVDDNRNVAAEESPKRKRNKKKKEKKTEIVPELPVMDQVPINPEFLRGFESFKGQEEILQQIVALCSQLKPDEITPQAGLHPFFPSPYIDPAAFGPSPTAKPSAYSGSFTPSTVASTNTSPHFAPMDLEASVGAATVESCLFGMKPLLFDKVHPNGSPNAMAPMNLPVSLFARDGPFP